MRNFIFLFLTVAMVFVSPAMAERKSISFEMGTLGFGINYAMETPFYSSKNKLLNIRFSANYLDLRNFYGLDREINFTETSSAGEVSNRKTNTKGSISLLMALFDWHPNNGNFRITLGAVYNDTKATQTLNATNHEVEINGTVEKIDYTRETSIVFNKSAAYFGIGYGTSLRSKRGLTMNVSLGVLYQGEPDLEMKVSGPDADKYNQELDSIRAEAKNRLKNSDGYSKLNNYPHVAVGLEYKL